MTFSFVALLLAIPLPAQAPPASPGASGRGTSIETSLAFRLLSNKYVRGELKLTGEQSTQLAKIPDAIRAAHKDDLAEHLKKRTDAIEKRGHVQQVALEDFYAKAAKILQPRQATRLKQLVIQAQGTSAFLRDSDVLQSLKPSEEQKQSWTKIIRDSATAQSQARKQARQETGNEMEYRALLAEKRAVIAREIVAKLTATFTPEQRKTWKTLSGEPFAEPAALRLTLPPAERPRLYISLPLGFRTAHRLLLSDKVCQELELTKEQVSGMKAVAESIAKKYTEKTVQATASSRDVVRADRIWQGKLVDEARARVLADILEPMQAKRFKQLEFQARGLELFADMAILQALRLTPEQHQAVVSASAARTRDARAAQAKIDKLEANDVVAASKQAGERAADLNREAIERVAAALSAEQKKAWTELVGDPFDFKQVPERVLSTRFALRILALRKVYPARTYLRRATQAWTVGKYDEAVRDIKEALRLAPHDAEPLNSQAFLLASCPNPKYRDGKKAVEIAQRACLLSEEKDANDLDTLAIAFAEAGDFEQAVKWATKAIELANPLQKKRFEDRLKLFRNRKPYRLDQPK